MKIFNLSGTGGGGGAGTVTSIAPADTTLTFTPNPITTTGTIGITLSTSNTWTPSSGTLFTQNGIVTTPTTAVFLSNTTTSTVGVPVQISPALEFRGKMFRTGDSSDNTGTFRMYQIPASGSSAQATNAGTLQWDSSKNGSYSLNIMNLSRTGILTAAQGFTATNGNITASAGAINAANSITSTNGQVQAGSDLLTGTNGTFAGHVYFYGGTSGNMSISAASVVTSYNFALPAAGPSAAGQTFITDGAGGSNFQYITSQVGFPVDSTGNTAAITATTLLVPAVTSFYRLSFYLQVTTAASVSSVLGGTTGVVVTYQDGDGGIGQSITVPFASAGAGGIVINNSGNSTTTNLQGNIVIYAKIGVNVQYAIDYTSVGGTPMAYGYHIRKELL